MRSMARGLLGLATLGLTAACGGQLAASESDGGARPDGATSGAVSPAPTAAVGSGSSGGSSGAGAAPSGSSETASPPSEGADAGACGANILTHAPGTAFGTCWSCIAKGCSTQLAACMVDCACNGEIARALTCSDTGQASMCFLPTVTSGGDMQQAAMGNCILQVNVQCPPCQNLPPGI